MGQDTSFDPEGIPTRLQNRCEFLQLFGKGLGYGAVATVLPACGGDGGGSGSSSPDEGPSVVPKPVVPLASPEYTALKRTSFGPHRDAMTAIKNLGIGNYLEQQLDYVNISDGSLEADIQALFPLTLRTPLQLIDGFPDNICSVVLEMISATQYRQMFSQRQLYEIMVEFWSDHFNIHLVNGLGPTLKPFDDQQVIRVHALGNFRALLHASAESGAMQFYLDNFLNQAIAPNENYAAN